MFFYSTQKKGRRTFLVHIISPKEKYSQEIIEELKSLCKTAGFYIEQEIIVKLYNINAGYYIGKGKLDNIKYLIGTTENKIDVVIFGKELSPAQIRNLEKYLKKSIMDKTELILEIFHKNAKTKEAKLQIELARLEYLLPRLRRMWTHLERLEGVKGTRGPGEKQIEEDRRLLKKRINNLRKQLAKIQQRRELEISNRKDFHKVCFIGYTNAGKSSLMKALTGKDIIIEDKLFATLDTRNASLDIAPPGEMIILSDTVGFIRDLPPTIMEAFHTTLLEAINAELLIHVIDASSPNFIEHIEVVENILKKLNMDGKKKIHVFNKIDKVEDKVYLRHKASLYSDAILTSVKTGEGINLLKQKIVEMIFSEKVYYKIEIPYKEAKFLSYLTKSTNIIRKEYEEEGVNLTIEAPKKFIKKLIERGRLNLKIEKFHG